MRIACASARATKSTATRPQPALKLVSTDCSCTSSSWTSGCLLGPLCVPLACPWAPAGPCPFQGVSVLPSRLTRFPRLHTCPSRVCTENLSTWDVVRGLLRVTLAYPWAPATLCPLQGVFEYLSGAGGCDNVPEPCTLQVVVHGEVPTGGLTHACGCVRVVAVRSWCTAIYARGALAVTAPVQLPSVVVAHWRLYARDWCACGCGHSGER